MDYWHGGRRGIAVGDFIVAPDARRRQWTTFERSIERLARGSGYNVDRDPKRIYVTTDRELARGWAMNVLLRFKGGGALYRVKPLPPMSLEPDPDYAPTGFSARRAQVLEVVEDPVQMDQDEASRTVCLKYSLWVDRSPMYDVDGYMLPPTNARQAGATAEMYRHLGKWFVVPPGCSVWFKDGRAFVAPTDATDTSPQSYR